MIVSMDIHISYVLLNETRMRHKFHIW